MPLDGTATAASITLPLPTIPAAASPPSAIFSSPAAQQRPVSATLAANEALDARRREGQPVLPLAFGEAGLPAHPALCDALAAATARNGYGPVAGVAALRSAARAVRSSKIAPASRSSAASCCETADGV